MRGLSVGLGAEALFLEAVLVINRHVEDAVTRCGDRLFRLLLARRLHLRVFAPDVLSEHIVDGLLVTCWESCAAHAAQRAYLENLVHTAPPLPDKITAFPKAAKGKSTPYGPQTLHLCCYRTPKLGIILALCCTRASTCGPQVWLNGL